MRFNSLVLSAVLLISLANCFYSGVNLPWHYCGSDYGKSFDVQEFTSRFSAYARSGANVARVWIHFNGDDRYNYFDSDGLFLPLSDQFQEDFGQMLQIASDHHLQILISLWSFECVR